MSSQNPKPALQEQLHALLSADGVRTQENYRTLAQLTSQLTAVEQAQNKPWEDGDRAELDALLAEYTSIRQESINTITNRTQIMLLGLAAVGALGGGALTVDNLSKQRSLVFAIFSAAIPLMCAFVLLVWVSEAVRCHRAGYFLASEIEARINAKLGRLVMRWEAGLWTRVLPRDELFGPSMMALGIIGIISVSAPFFGVLLVGEKVTLDGSPLPALWVPYTFLLITASYVLGQMYRLRNNPVVRSRFMCDDSKKPKARFRDRWTTRVGELPAPAADEEIDYNRIQSRGVAGELAD